MGSSALSAFFRKHPRIRGESLIALHSIFFPRETSPHTRGKPRTCIGVSPEPGNIPAYAGKADPQRFWCLLAQKHPRIRGESLIFEVLLRHRRETSPHTRGKLSVTLPDGSASGNIPAYAGKAGFPLGRSNWWWKHPRIRGDSVISFLVKRLSVETSPHTRGKQLLDLQELFEPGNIPAYAGKAR